MECSVVYVFGWCNVFYIVNSNFVFFIEIVVNVIWFYGEIKIFGKFFVDIN